MSLDIDLRFEVDFGGPNGPETLTVWESNITSNLIAMFEALEVRDLLWFKTGEIAGDSWKDLDKAVRMLEAYPNRYREYNAPNGWGTVEDALRFLTEARDAFKHYPKATIYSSI